MFKNEEDMIEFERIDKKELTGFPRVHFFICLCKTQIQIAKIEFIKAFTDRIK